ncbi:PREDICTED: uncharacterized protein LOC107070273 [Polistes dominula]|uniref:Uncharacterized protein LOC107070273 n=1 Tax=Polistes dominula TaxID=743375 RepID=A0ABM1IUB4_POLDO|nr:PREDICTED: uncharacterized protein LOC107070273 [Polistes dominula]
MSSESTTEQFTTESQQQSTTESQEQSTTESQQQSTTESQEQSTTEFQEQSTIESQESTTEKREESTTESNESTSVTTEPSMVTPCPIGNLTDEQITLVCPTGFRRHPRYCNLFYQCTNEGNMEIKVLVLSCPENTVFDEHKIQCLPENEVSQGCTGLRANARFYRKLEENSITPVKVSSQPLCPDVGHYPYRQGCSNTFYKCKRDSRNNLQGYFYKCPVNFIYWSVSRRCERATRLPMCTHLAFRKNDFWDSRWQLPVEDVNLSARALRLF